MPGQADENAKVKQRNLREMQSKIKELRSEISGFITQFQAVVVRENCADEASYRELFQSINSFCEKFGQPKIAESSMGDSKSIELFLKATFKDAILTTFYSGLTFIADINTAIDSQDQVTNTPLRNLNFYLDAFNSTWFKEKFYPGSPAMLVSVGISAISFVYYVTDKKQKDKQCELNSSSIYLLESLSKHNAELDENEKKVLIRHFNVVNSKYLLQHFAYMLAAIDLDITDSLQAKKKQESLFNRMQNSRVMKFITPIWGAIGMYSMGYWIVGMTTGYAFGVWLGGAIMVLGPGFMFGWPAIIPLLFLAFYGGLKLYQYIQERKVAKTITSNVKEVEIDVIKQKLAMQEDLSVLEKAHLETYIETQAFVYKRKLSNLTTSHPELAVKALPCQDLSNTEKKDIEPKAISNLRRATFKRVFFGTLFGFLSGYMITQTKFQKIHA